MCSLECTVAMEGMTNAVFQSSNSNLTRASEGSESFEMRMDVGEPSSSSFSQQQLQESEEILTTASEKSDVFEDVELSEGRDTLPDDLVEIGRRMSERAYPCNCHKYCNGNSSYHRSVDHTSNGDVEQAGKCKSMWSRTQHSKRLKMIIPHGGERFIEIYFKSLSAIYVKLSSVTCKCDNAGKCVRQK